MGEQRSDWAFDIHHIMPLIGARSQGLAPPRSL